MYQFYKVFEDRKITSITRRWLLFIMISAFLLTIIVFNLIGRTAITKNADSTLIRSVSDVRQDVLDASDAELLSRTKKIAEELDAAGKMDFDERQQFLKELRNIYDVQDIFVINPKGIIVGSATDEYILYDMASGEQSAAFLCLLSGEESFVQDYQSISANSDISRKYAGVKLESGGFVQVGYDANRFRTSIDSAAASAARNRHVGQSGSILIVAEDGEIISSPIADSIGRNVSEYGMPSENLINMVSQGETYSALIMNVNYECVAMACEGYYIFGIMPESELMQSLDLTIAIVDGLVLLAFIILFSQVYRLLNKLVVNNISSVTSSLSRIAAGDLDVSVDVKGTEEFEALSRDINTTVSSLKAYAEKEAKRLEEELEYAKNIQRSALPMLFPPFPGRSDFEIFATMDPAKEVGGDFFDFELLNKSQLLFCIADVSGKGIPAALFMMRAKTMIRSYAVAGHTAGEILREVNNELCKGNDAGMFVTCWLGILNTDTGVVQFANAGHNPPVICRKNGKFEFIQGMRPGFVLAGMDGIKYKDAEISLNPGDRIFLYTDGVTEANNVDGELFGDPRLIAALNNTLNSSCTERCITIRKEIDSFVGEAPQFDDITMLSLQYEGSGNTITEDAVIANYDKFIRFIEEQLELTGCPMVLVPKINIAMDELITNVISYAYGDAIGPLNIKVSPCSTGRSGVVISLTDYGVPFNPLEAPDPDITLEAKDRPTGKLGIYLVKKLMDKVEYSYIKGNVLTLTKYF